MIAGEVAIDGQWGLPPLGPGRTVLIPAGLAAQTLRPVGDRKAKLLRVTLG